VWLACGDQGNLEFGSQPLEEVVDFAVNPSVGESRIGLVGYARETETWSRTSK